MGADEVADAIVRASRALAVARSISSATALGGCSGSSPSWRSATPKGRVAYGPVDAGSVPELVNAGMLDGSRNRLWLGLTDEIEFLKRQTRLVFSRVGVIEPLSVAEYEATGGLTGLRRALEMTPQQIVSKVTESGLRGRGGAGFPTGIKWQTVLDIDSELKFIASQRR